MVRFESPLAQQPMHAACSKSKKKNHGKFNSACSSAGEGTPGTVCNSVNLDTGFFVEALRCTFRCQYIYIYAEVGLNLPHADG